MSSFTTPLIVEALPGGRRWKLVESFTFWSATNKVNAIYISVPSGFTTDFASVPRPFWPLISPYGKAGKAAVIHDFLYYKNRIGEGWFTRAQADLIFLEAMGVLGVAAWRKYAMYWAVR